MILKRCDRCGSEVPYESNGKHVDPERAACRVSLWDPLKDQDGYHPKQQYDLCRACADHFVSWIARGR